MPDNNEAVEVEEREARAAEAEAARDAELAERLAEREAREAERAAREAKAKRHRNITRHIRVAEQDGRGQLHKAVRATRLAARYIDVEDEMKAVTGLREGAHILREAADRFEAAATAIENEPTE